MPTTRSWTERIAATIFSASAAVPKVVTARKYDVRWSRPHGSPSKPEWSMTPAIASGCSDCSSRARMPPTNIEASPCTWRIRASSSNQRGPDGPVDALAAAGSLGPGHPREEPLAEGGAEVAERGR